MAKRWFTITNKADAPAAEILIYGTIGKDWDGEGTGAKEFREAFNAIPAGRKINVHINSPGGVISEGFGIYNTMLPRAGDITTFNDGYALSCGSFLMLAGDTRKAPKNAIFMTHKPSGGVYGDANDMRQYADILDVHQDSIASIYMQRAGLSEADANALMETETWMNAEEAKSKGFVTELIDGDAATNAFDLSQFSFKNLPEGLRPANASTQLPTTANNPSALSGAVQGGIGVSPTETTEAPRNEGATNERIIVNRDEMIALLKNRGVTVPDNCTDQWLKEEVAKLQPATNGTTTTGNTEGTANTGAANNVITLSPETITALATAMSTQTANTLPGAAPLNVRPRVENVGDAYDKMLEAKPGAERRNHIVAAWNDIGRAGVDRKIWNVNTVAAALTTNLLSDTVITTIGVKLAALRALFVEVMPDAVKPKATIEIPLVSSGSALLTNPTDWESGDTVVGNVEITMNEYAHAFHVTNLQLQSGTQMAWIAEKNARAFAEQLMDIILTPITEAIYGASLLVSAEAAFGPSDLPTVRAGAKNFSKKNLVLDGGYFSRLIPTNTEGLPVGDGSPQFGFDGIWENNQWPAAVGNIRGFACSPEALAIATGLPIEPPGFGTAFAQVGSAVIPGLNIGVQTASWVKPGTRVQWNAFDLMLGVKQADTSALVSIKTA